VLRACALFYGALDSRRLELLLAFNSQNGFDGAKENRHLIKGDGLE